MRTTTIIALFLGLGCLSLNANATVIHTIGAGTAVSTVDTTADFESTASLATTYSEGDMTFTRVGVSTNNNGCGYAGCSGSFHPYGFVGNYFYGAGSGGYIEIESDTAPLTAMEFTFGWGPNQHAYYFEAFLGGIIVGSGNGLANAGAVLGISRAAGFDTIRFTDSAFTSAITSLAEGASPGIDNVRAQYGVPAPGALFLLLFGLLGLGIGSGRVSH